MGVWSYRFKRTTLLLWCCFGVLIGLAGSRTGLVLSPAWFWLILGSIGLLIGQKRPIGLLSVVLIGLSCGGVRGDQRVQQLSQYGTLYDQNISLKVSANEDAVYGKGGQLTFVGIRIINLETGEPLAGQVGISGRGLNGIYQDDEIIVYGKLREGIGSYQGFMSYAQFELVKQNPTLLADIRRKFAASISSTIPEPQASFAMGILLGQRASLPEEVEVNLHKVGLTHIVAVSGANLMIMLEASRKLFGKRSKRITAWLSLSLMLTFVLMTSGTASIVRAAFVSGLSVLLAYYGKRPRPLLIISFVAAVTAMINPIYIWSDASWYLSFLAFFGVLMLSPLLQSRLPKPFETNILLAILLESICAEIMSLPYILYTFGEMSFVGLLANIMVVSFIPYAMLTSFVAGLAGLFLWPLAGWFAWPAKFINMYMLDTAHVLANWPGVFDENIWLNAHGLAFTYVLIAGMIWLMNYKTNPESAMITDKNIAEPHRILGRLG